jgi:hypothetical protein
MAISDLFRSKHKHSDPAVRAEAVRTLAAEDADMLASIAREDEAESVRRLAIERLADPALLIEIAGVQEDPELKRLAEARASGVLVARLPNKANDEARAAVAKLAQLSDQRGLTQVVITSGTSQTVRELAFDQITDARALADVARSNAAPQIRLAAIRRISDSGVLRGIAIDEQNKDIAVGALDRIADADVLETIAARAKTKAARARARRILTDMGRPQPAAAPVDEGKRLHAEAVQLVRNVELLADRHEWIHSLAEIEVAESAFGELGSSIEQSLRIRFEAACTRYRARREKYGSEAELRASEEAAEAEAEAATVVEVRLMDAPRVIEMVAPLPAEMPAEALAANEAVESDADAAVEPAADEAVEPEADEEADEAVEPAVATSDDSAAKAAPVRATKEDNLEVLRRIVLDLEGVDQIKKLKTGERKLSKTQQAFEALDALPHGAEASDLVARYHAGHKALFILVQELREADEWQRWANVPKREELVARAKTLAEAEPSGNLANRLKDLQDTWKAGGPVPQKRGQELWEEFKAQCDLVYEKVKAHRAVQAEERRGNLEAKLALCERVEAIKDSTDWAQTAEEIKRLQAEWKQGGPLPRKHADAVWKRFRAACDHFFERRKPILDKTFGEQQDNLEKKQAMCVEAEKLAEPGEGFTEWKDAAERLKKMQRDWRFIGHVPRKEANAINGRFRAACDKFFAARDEHFRAMDAARDASLTELADALKALPGDGDGDGAGEAAVQQILSLRQQVLQARGSAEVLEQLRAALRTAQVGVVEKFPDAVKGTDLDPAQSKKRMEKLCARAEDLAPAAPATSAAPATPEEMAERLRQAFSKNALGGVNSRTGGRPPSETIAELRDAWMRLAPMPGPEGEALAARFERACQRTIEADKQR